MLLTWNEYEKTVFKAVIKNTYLYGWDVLHRKLFYLYKRNSIKSKHETHNVGRYIQSIP